MKSLCETENNPQRGVVATDRLDGKKETNWKCSANGMEEKKKE